MVEIRIIEKDSVADVIPALAGLRIRVFRDFPYLYDGDAAYEEAYLQAYRESEQAIIVGAFHNGRLVGAATGTPLADHHEEFGEAFKKLPLEIENVFYCAESVLLPEWRGQGIGHRFFDEREDHARRLGFTHCCFCAVVRESDHPERPAGYSPLDRFWSGRGYRKSEGVVTSFSWKDIGEEKESSKKMQFWLRVL